MATVGVKGLNTSYLAVAACCSVFLPGDVAAVKTLYDMFEL